MSNMIHLEVKGPITIIMRQHSVQKTSPRCAPSLLYIKSSGNYRKKIW